SVAENADRWAATVGDGLLTGSIAKNDAVFIPAPPELAGNLEFNPVTVSPDGRWAIVSVGNADKLGIFDLNVRRWAKFAASDHYTYATFSRDSRWCWLGTGSELWQMDMQS